MTIDLPNHAVTMFCDDTNIYVALPLTKGGHHLITFALTESGLARALNLLRQRKVKTPTTTAYVTPSKYTLEQRAAAAKAIRSLR